ncbi:MAG: hypothetical protein Q8O40_05800 [Chloroflexota bacterium]|nr:hypothetical protein [Chloroflexota bacterium]
MTLPLSVLAQRLQAAPPSLGALLNLIAGAEGFEDFQKLVREYLPDCEHDILAGQPREQVAAFAQHFRVRYFPLHESMEWGEVEEEYPYSDVLTAIPIRPIGISWDDYHELEAWSTGLQLLMALVSDPYFETGEPDDGARVALLESCAVKVDELVKRIPKHGWGPEELHKRLDGTRYAAAALCADWLWHQTDTPWLDLTYEDMDGGGLDWCRENVEWFTQQWPRVEAIEGGIHDLAAWLEEAPEPHFRELLDAIRDGGPKRARRPRTLVEVFTNGDKIAAEAHA